ncbi:kinase-like protein, partial [Marasmius fiardii PR-910]
SSILAIMLRLSKKSGLHSRCLTIQNVRKLGHYPVASGGFGDVWKGVIGNSSESVCLKVVKLYLNSDVEKLCKAYLREAIVWRQLKHPNVLPFLGIYFLENNQQVCLISPWMEKGNLVQYVRLERSQGNIDHYSLVYDVAIGLSYLHSRKVVHGDLKGVNILITRSGRACIGDFGLSRVAETQELHLTTSTTRPVGTSRWLAPELLNGGRTSKESDIYAYGCVCYEIFTGLHPFPDLLSDGAVVLHVVQGKYSPRPKNVSEPDDSMWALMKSCWSLNPPTRPTAEEILSTVQRHTLESVVAEFDQTDTLSREIWNNVHHEPLSIIPGFESHRPEQSDSLYSSSSPGRHTSSLPNQARYLEHDDATFILLSPSSNSRPPDLAPSRLPPPPLSSELRDTEGGTSQASIAPLQWKKKASRQVHLDRQSTSLSDDLAKLMMDKRE